VSAFAIEPGNVELRPLNSRTTGGGGACHVTVDRTSRCVAVANYGGGSCAAFPVGEGGALGERSAFLQHEGSGADPKRQGGPHAHSVTVTPDNALLLVADLGLDRVMLYRLDAEAAKLAPHDPAFIQTAPGAGPRHVAFHPNGRFLYLINEIDGTLSAYAYDSSAMTFAPVNTLSTLPDGFSGNSICADVHVSPDGRFVYGTNRGHNSVAVYRIRPETGAIELVEITPCGGDHPRNFAIVAGGRFVLVANQNGNNIVSFAVDGETGRLTPTGDEAAVPLPVCVLAMG
jgi:6-phosphogluconolactonase